VEKATLDLSNLKPLRVAPYSQKGVLNYLFGDYFGREDFTY
jgi:hypothetical protein